MYTSFYSEMVALLATTTNARDAPSASGARDGARDVMGGHPLAPALLRSPPFLTGL